MLPISSFHTSGQRHADFDPEIKSKDQLRKDRHRKFLEYNDVIYPPQKPGEPARPAVGYTYNIDTFSAVYYGSRHLCI